MADMNCFGQESTQPGAIGFCLGASTVSAVVLDQARRVTRVVHRNHEGNPERSFQELVDSLHADSRPMLVTGRKFRHFVNLPSISETEATEYALQHVRNGSDAGYDVVISAGAETFMAYTLNGEQRITGISTGNKCASGTGEFFLQQVRRMGLDAAGAVEKARTGSPYHVSGRCSVFCKSDCTHALNKGERIDDVTAGLCKMMAGKITDLLARIPHKRVMLVGGTSRNDVVIGFVRESVPGLDIPDEAPYFEALGAAVAAFDRGVPRPGQLLRDRSSSFRFLSPLRDHEALVTFKPPVLGVPVARRSYIIGLDVGSTTTKAVLMDREQLTICGSVYLRTNGNPVLASQACYRSLLEQIGERTVKIAAIGVTGSGRKIAGLFSGTGSVINEIIAHATAAIHFDPEVDTVFEIGGQDAKYTQVIHEVPSDYAMNEACSAGTGSFLEEAAHESLGVAVKEIADLALLGKRPPNFSDQCSAFISSDIKNATHEGFSREDILAGLVYSIGFNYLNRVKGNRPVGKKIFMQGGVCYNRAVPLAVAGILRREIVVPPEPGLMGALGVALEVKKRMDQGLIAEEQFDLSTLTHRTIEYRKPFICAGGKEKCDLKCSINRIEIGGEIHPFGGACNRYYNQRTDQLPDETGLNLVAFRNKLMFNRPATGTRVRAGVSRSFFTQRLFPLYHEFFAALGIDVVLPDRVHEEAFNRQTSSMCFPGEVSLGLVDNLLDKEPDFLFLPHVKELFVEGGDHRPWFCSTCLLSQGEPFIVQGAFQDRLGRVRVLAPTLNFNGGWEKAEKGFVAMAGELGVGRRQAAHAFRRGIAAQMQFERTCREEGAKALAELRADPSRIGIVLFGRSYNSLSPEANKGIPKKITSRGYLIIPYEMIPYMDVPMNPEYGEYMHWEAGQRILKAAEFVSRDPQLFGLFVTNFLCAPDSFIIQYFRRTMGAKPNLILELDAHTADAGLNTRIEAFLDIVRNYRGLKEAPRRPGADGFRLARISMENKGNFYIDSAGTRVPLRHPSVRLILPSMGDLGTKLAASACERFGIHTSDLPQGDSEVLHVGRSVATGKECLPYMIVAGSILKYVEARPDDERTVVFMPKASGYCRFGQYHVALNYLARDRKIRNLAMLSLGMEENWAGMGPGFSVRLWKSALLSDIMGDVRSAIWALAEDPEEGMRVLEEEVSVYCDLLSGAGKAPFYRSLEESVARLSRIPLRCSLDEVAQIALTGEIYIRQDRFSNFEMVRKLSDRGFVVKTAPIHEWVYYANYLIKNGLTKPDFTLPGYIEFFVSDKVQVRIEKRIKSIFAASGLYEPEMIDIEDTLRYMRPLIGKEVTGEAELISGLVLRDALNHYAGVISVGPFGCMQTRFAEAITEPVANAAAKKEAWLRVGREPDFDGNGERIPFLTIESDGNPFPQLLEARFENFCIQAGRVAEKQKKRLTTARESESSGVR
jgi:predicted CoA-substrate-specific enzyme activase